MAFSARQQVEQVTPNVARSSLNLSQPDQGATAEILHGGFPKDLSQTNLISVQQDATHNMLGPLPEEGSVASLQSHLNQGSLSMNGTNVSDMSVNEVYESYQFMQNSLISFYPKDVRRCFQRRRTLNAAQLA